MTPQTLTTKQGRTIAFHQVSGAGPGVVFLGGLRSDMQGSKALHLEAWAKRSGRAFLRFDYSGHGESSGHFTEGCIGDWAEDAEAAILTLTEGPQILVGSSMGGWQALLLARKHPDLVAGLVGIAAAPDFTEDGMWDSWTADQRAELMTTGQVALPSDYGEPYVITRRMIEDGRNQLVLRSPMRVTTPVRILQGTDDADVDQSVALRLLAHLDGADIRLTLVKGADHRFSDDSCLGLIVTAIEEILTHV